jgi:hypothetical protein
MRKWLVRFLLCFTCILAVALVVALARNVFYNDREEKRQGWVIVDEIKTRDNSITAYWSPGRGSVTISVYSVTAEDKQDQLLEWINALKAKGDIDRAITVNFYERENWIEKPPNELGVRSGYRGSENLIRTVEL